MKKLTLNELRGLVLSEIKKSGTKKRYSISQALYEDADKEVEDKKDEKPEAAKQKEPEALDANMLAGPVKDFSPAQREIGYDKSLDFAIGMLDKNKPEYQPAGELGGVATNDRKFLDGNHRWAASYMINPDSPITTAKVDMDFEQAKPVMQGLGLAKGHVEGNIDSGRNLFGGNVEFQQFKQDVKDLMSKHGLSHDDLKKGISDHMGIKESEQDHLEEESPNWMQSMHNNYKSCSAHPTDGLPAKVDLPMLPSPEVPDMQPDEPQTEQLSESRKNRRRKELGRWQRLAGL
jgi:hypothetical protein